MNLQDSLRRKGEARIDLSQTDYDNRGARHALIDAAKEVGVRITFVKGDKGIVTARVLNASEAKGQAERDMIFRASNDVKEAEGWLHDAVEKLEDDKLADVGVLDDVILDLKDIIAELEEEARNRFRGATG